MVWPNHWRGGPRLRDSSHILGMFGVILRVIFGPIKPQKTEYWHAYCYSNGSMAFVLLAYIGQQRLTRQGAIHPCSSQINCMVASNGRV